VEGRVRDDGTWEITLGKDLVIRHRPVDEFDARMFLLFLRTISLPDAPYKPPRTQPLLRQEWLASWFGVLQEEISRWQTYQRRGDWRRLMSRRAGDVVPLEQQQAIINLWARHPWWDVATATAQCQAQGLEVRRHQVEQVGHESGLLLIRQVLRERYHLDASQFRPKDAWLTQRQSALIDTLQAHVEAGTALPPEQRAQCADLARLRDEVGIGPSPAADASPPWGYRMQQVLLGQDEGMDDEAIRCPHCGTAEVRRKSRQPRLKRFLDAQGQEQQVAVYRYYCTNPDCAHQTFTHLPPDLVPYSRHRTTLRIQALQAYELGRGTYRTTARALGISTATAYRWLTAGGSALLPVAQLFGVVRSSGIVGVDEKWVKVPHNDKPPGKHRRWMYVYTAVDVWTYDLLHIAIAPHLGQDSARMFLQELRAKGYRPQVIVTDLSTDYPAAIAQVFPHAEHHLCVFHALKTWQRTLREVYGKDYRERHPAATTLHRQLVQLCRARTKRTAQRRVAAIHALRADYVAADPDVAAVFDSLERHWPKLVNAIESRRIPLTNNATELVNRRFDQHYQNFCGFQTIETAQRYLAIFERTYRLTPFTADAQPRIRGKCPLELAGYDVSAIPLARVLAAQPPDTDGQPPGADGVPTG
jgi:transposase-like protein